MALNSAARAMRRADIGNEVEQTAVQKYVRGIQTPLLWKLYVRFRFRGVFVASHSWWPPAPSVARKNQWAAHFLSTCGPTSFREGILYSSWVSCSTPSPLFGCSVYDHLEIQKKLILFHPLVFDPGSLFFRIYQIRWSSPAIGSPNCLSLQLDGLKLMVNTLLFFFFKFSVISKSDIKIL